MNSLVVCFVKLHLKKGEIEEEKTERHAARFIDSIFTNEDKLRVVNVCIYFKLKSN
jgi:hypothetical protein